MEAIKLVKKISGGIMLVLKCVGLALAVAVFACLVLEEIPAQDAVKVLSLAVICLSVGWLHETRRFKNQ